MEILEESLEVQIFFFKRASPYGLSMGMGMNIVNIEILSC
jgi:hypothetical protein